MSHFIPEQVTYFIADLHLAQNRPDITACFLSFLKNQAPQAEKLYILGDLFESWIGDDDDCPFVTDVAAALLALKKTGTEILFIHGNRDFLLGRKFADKSGMILLPEVSLIDLYGKPVVILHGDTLCTRDIAYQAFRKKSRSWWWQTMVKSLPLFIRRKIAANYRQRSAAATAMKAQDIMDVTPQEVVNCMERYHCNLMIHGHTHRPDIHELDVNNHEAKRIVLGDWYEQGAWLKVTKDKTELLYQPFISKP
ncbi:UDP-2,3-diacylglucosamine diphosphatase [Colwelliaceae bacterium 6471]